MWSFEDDKRDIGTALKESAEKLYKGGIKIQTVILVLAIVGGVVSALDEGSFVPFFIIAGSALVEYLIAYGIIYSVSIHRYAEGEKVHLLESIVENTQGTSERGVKEENASVATVIKPATATGGSTSVSQFIAQTNTNKTALPPDGWRCACGKTHPPYVSSCVCGRSKHDQ